MQVGILSINFHTAYASGLDNISDFAYTSGDSSITLSWTNPDSLDMAGVLVARSTASISWNPVDGTVYNFGDNVGTDTTIIYYSTGEEYTDSPLTNDINYYFKAFTFDYDAVYSSGSEELSTTPVADNDIPLAPTKLTGNISSGVINLSWIESISEDAQRYKTSCLPDNYLLPELSDETDNNNTSLSNAIIDTTYTCSVQTIDYSNNYSDPSESINLIEKSTSDSSENIYPPQNLTGEMINRDAKLNWIQNSSKAAIGFNVYIKCSDETLYNKANNQVILDTNYTVNSLYYDYTCNFYVTSIDENLNESTPSNIILLETGSRDDNSIKTFITTGDGQANIKWSYGNGNDSDSNGDNYNNSDYITDKNTSDTENIYLDGVLLGKLSSPVTITNLDNNKDYDIQVGDDNSTSTSINPPSSNVDTRSGTSNSNIENIEISLNENGQPQISWDLECESCIGFAGIKIYRNLNPTDSLELLNNENLLITKSPFIDTDTSDGNEYSYTLETFNLGGDNTNTDTTNIITSQDATNAGYFNDVMPGHVFFDYIEALRLKAVVHGYDGHIFKPYQPITRVEALKMIMRSSNIIPNESFTFHTYRDLATNTWFYEYIQTGSLEGIVRGYDDGLFRPNRNVSRIEFLKMVMESGDVNITSQNSSSFGDLTVGFWGTDYANLGYLKNIISGYSDGTFRPNQPITRAEAAKIVSYLLD